MRVVPSSLGHFSENSTRAEKAQIMTVQSIPQAANQVCQIMQKKLFKAA
jgi:prephenate dehydratase